MSTELPEMPPNTGPLDAMDDVGWRHYWNSRDMALLARLRALDDAWEDVFVRHNYHEGRDALIALRNRLRKEGALD